MKKHLLLAILIICTITTYAQTSWVSRIGPVQNDHVAGELVLTPDSGFIINSSPWGVESTRFDQYGNILWRKTIPVWNNVECIASSTTIYYLYPQWSGPFIGLRRVRTDNEGNFIDSVTVQMVSGSASEVIASIKAFDNKFLVYFTSQTNSILTTHVAMVDTSANIIWQHPINSSQQIWNLGKIYPLNNGKILIQTTHPDTSIIETDFSGTVPTVFPSPKIVADKAFSEGSNVYFVNTLQNGSGNTRLYRMTNTYDTIPTAILPFASSDLTYDNNKIYAITKIRNFQLMKDYPALTICDTSGNVIKYIEYASEAHNNDVHTGFYETGIKKTTDGGFAFIYTSDSTSAIQNIHLFKIKQDGTCEDNLISGTVIKDDNSNCLQDVNENTISNILISISGTGTTEYTFSAANGQYQSNSSDGPRYISAVLPPYRTLVCPSATYSVVLNSDTIGGLNFYVNETANITDLETDLISLRSATANRPARYIARVKNVGTDTASTILTVTLSPEVNVSLATPNPSSQSGNQFTFLINNLAPLSVYDVIFAGYYDTTLFMGDTIMSFASVAAPASEQAITNNLDSIREIGTGPYDPNDKSVFPKDTINHTQELEYLIRFQNTGTDTAVTVKITDHISPYLDLTTFHLMNSSFPCSASINSSRTITFMFTNIMLPDSNVNEVASHGFVKYKIKPVMTAQTGTAINNTAQIYFDYNSPIITNTTTNIIGTTASVSIKEIPHNAPLKIYPNPTDQVIRIDSEDANARALIYDISGREIMNGRLKSGCLDVGSLPAGIYFIRINEASSIRNGNFIKIASPN